MSQELINIGTSPNDGSGDPLRVAFQKINNNFSQLFSSGFLTYQVVTYDNTPNQVVFEVPANAFTQGTFQINSANPSTNDSQNITINASIQNDLADVKWNGHSTIIVNDYVVSGYDVVVDGISGNIQVLVSPSVNATLNHLISAQVEVANFTLGTPIGIEGFANTALVTQGNIVITTEQLV
jgi:hypothetical protein